MTDGVIKTGKTTKAAVEGACSHKEKDLGLTPL